MWGVYYSSYVVTGTQRQDNEKQKYYEDQKKLLKEGKITKIIPFKEYRVCAF